MYTFTEKAYGEAIEASHVNDLQTAVATLGGGMFYPESYGAVGDGSTDDTAAIQAAIDAASVNGGNVILNKTYAIGSAGKRSFGEYPNVNYALLVNVNNVHVWGPGTLVLATMPTVENGAFAALVFGDGITERQNVGCHGVTVDATALSDANLTTMSTSSVGASIGFYKCRDFVCENNIIRNGWGYNGAIHTILGTHYGHILNNRVHTAKKTGMWIDGLRYSTVSGNWIWNAGVHGIFNATNNDIEQNPIENTIANNHVIGFAGIGIGANGPGRLKITNNYIYRTTALAGSAGIWINAQASALGNYPALENAIAGNVIYRDTAAIGGHAIILQGVDSSPLDASQVVCDQTRVMGNVVNGGWSYGCRLRQSATNNKILMNIFDTYVADILTDEEVTITGNTKEPNY